MYNLAVNLSVPTRTDIKDINKIIVQNKLDLEKVKFQVQIDSGIVVCYWLK